MRESIKYRVTLSKKNNWNFNETYVVWAVNEIDAMDIAYCELFEQYEETDENYVVKSLERLS